MKTSNETRESAARWKFNPLHDCITTEDGNVVLHVNKELGGQLISEHNEHEALNAIAEAAEQIINVINEIRDFEKNGKNTVWVADFPTYIGTKAQWQSAVDSLAALSTLRQSKP